MDLVIPPPTRRVCLRCGRRDATHARCPVCGGAVEPRPVEPPWGAACDRRSAAPSAALVGLSSVVLFTAPPAAILGALSLLVDLLGVSSHGALMLGGLLAVALGVMVALSLSDAVGRWLKRAAVASLARRDRARLAAATLREHAAVAEGPVRVAGTVVARSLAAHPDASVSCVAFANRPPGGVAREHWGDTEAAGGLFDLVDARGAALRVRAQHVAVLDGVALPDGSVVVPLGARVEVLGHARRVADARHDGYAVGPGYRDAGRAFELAGTRERPVVIRVIEPFPARDAVRVASELAETDARDEQRARDDDDDDYEDVPSARANRA